MSKSYTLKLVRLHCRSCDYDGRHIQIKFTPWGDKAGWCDLILKGPADRNGRIASCDWLSASSLWFWNGMTFFTEHDKARHCAKCRLQVVLLRQQTWWWSNHRDVPEAEYYVWKGNDTFFGAPKGTWYWKKYKVTGKLPVWCVWTKNRITGMSKYEVKVRWRKKSFGQ